MNNTNDPPITKAISFKRAAEGSDTSHWHWRRMADSGAIKTIRIGKRRLIPLAEYERILSQGTIANQP